MMAAVRPVGIAGLGRYVPERLLTNAGARPGEVLILTKKLGTGVLVNAARAGKLSQADFRPVLEGMARLNGPAATAALEGGIADIQAAIADQNKIAGVITKVGQVVQTVSSVIPAGA